MNRIHCILCLLRLQLFYDAALKRCMRVLVEFYIFLFKPMIIVLIVPYYGTQKMQTMCGMSDC